MRRILDSLKERRCANPDEVGIPEYRALSASSAWRGRVEILNWRKHGDDESYCRIEVFAADDLTETTSLVEKEYEVRAGAEDEGDYDATYYVNDDITISDGDIMTSHDGRRFRIGVVLTE
jgi:hypothetical protein